ncbi:MAG: DUF5395 domain-containing protein [Pseudomonadota bacterium]|nr:MAG: DUF5395 domain-containing protein [Pseudomonadota bacterium]
MKADLEMNLIHDGRDWIVRSEKLEARGENFADLDEDLKRTLRDSGDYPQGSHLTVFMGFDFDTIPTWLRQYHTHYFNRFVAVDL